MSTTQTTTRGALGFAGPLDVRPKYHANDSSLDVMNTVLEEVDISDARSWTRPPSLDVEGFTLVPHKSTVSDFREAEEVERIHVEEIRKLLLEITGADEVVVTGKAILRFGEKSQDSGALDNSKPARFVHIDVSDKAAAQFTAPVRDNAPRPICRIVQYNVWRAISPPPQDVPLALCDAGSLSPEDLVAADAMFDIDGEIRFSFEGLLIRHNPKQRWAYFSNMTRDEALIFKTNDSDPSKAHHVPHGAFDDTSCPPDVTPRASVEMRGMAVWYE